MMEKKNNYDNPLGIDNISQFLSVHQNAPEKENPNKTGSVKLKQTPIQDRPKTDKNGRELKRKRYNLLLFPSVYEGIEKIAYVQKTSANEVINRALASFLEKEKGTLEKYDEIEMLKSSVKKKSE